MTTFPGSPKTQRGAIVGLDPINPMVSVIVFSTTPTRSRNNAMGSLWTRHPQH